jgi:hypothetical protein
MGSIRDARHAGISDAMRTIVITNARAALNDTASVGLTP